jgi:hypothetical protein
MKARGGSRARADELITLGRKVAATQRALDNRPEGEWLAYGQACQDALSRGHPVPRLRPASAPLAPPLPPPRYTDEPPTTAWDASEWPAPSQRSSLAPSVASARSGPEGVVPILCASCSRPIHEEESGKHPVIARRAWRFGWGVAWRYAILAGLFVFAQSRPEKPWLVILGVLIVGLLLGLWRRRSGLARLWRTVVVAGGAVYVAPLFAIYPDVLVGSIGALTLGPLLATWRRE